MMLVKPRLLPLCLTHRPRLLFWFDLKIRHRLEQNHCRSDSAHDTFMSRCNGTSSVYHYVRNRIMTNQQCTHQMHILIALKLKIIIMIQTITTYVNVHNQTTPQLISKSIMPSCPSLLLQVRLNYTIVAHLKSCYLAWVQMRHSVGIPATADSFTDTACEVHVSNLRKILPASDGVTWGEMTVLRPTADMNHASHTWMKGCCVPWRCWLHSVGPIYYTRRKK